MGGQNLVWGLMQDGNDGWEDFLIDPGFLRLGIDVSSENLALNRER